MRGMCSLCQRTSDNVQAMMYNDDEDMYLCPTCWEYEITRADAEYERQREDGNVDLCGSDNSNYLGV